jgi:phospholipase/carboxylesterase
MVEDMTDLTLHHLVRPARAGSPPHPGIVLMHGLGDDEAGLHAMGAYLDPRLYALSVRAPEAYRWGGYTWYDIERDGPGLGSESIERALDLARSFLQEALTEYPLDPDRFYLGGFSLGAAMAGALALLFPELVRGAVMVSGFLPPGEPERYRSQEAAGHPIFQAHGLYDQVVPLEAARRTRDFLLGTPVELTYREYPTGHDVTPEELADLAGWFRRVLDSDPRE